MAQPAQHVAAAAAQIHDPAKGAARSLPQPGQVVSHAVRQLQLLAQPLQLGVHAPHERHDVRVVEDVVRGRHPLDEVRGPQLTSGPQTRHGL